MARKTREESAKTRELILDAAELVFSRRGVGSATIAHIAETAGISRGAIYGHYKNKIDVCLAMCRRGYSRALIPPQLYDRPLALDTLFLMGAWYMRMVYNPCSLQRVVQVLYFRCENSAENAPLFRFRSCMEKLHRREMRKVLRKAIAQGELAPNLELSLAYIFLDSLTSGIYHARAWSERLREDFWTSVDHVLRTGIEGLRNSAFLRTPCPPLPELPIEARGLCTDENSLLRGANAPC